jgi:hypothetical protein
MHRDDIVFWVTLASAGCWLMCFWWMHRISSKQNALLKQLADQSARIEELSKDEHDLIKEVHPQIGDIKSKVDEVADEVKG